MIVAFIMSITVLPAMLRLLNPPAEPHPLGYAFLSPVDRFLERNRIPVLVITLCTVLAASPLLYWLRFDFNPMDLRNPHVESVATYLDLKKDPEMSGQTIEVLEPSLAEADALAKKTQRLARGVEGDDLEQFRAGGSGRQACPHRRGGGNCSIPLSIRRRSSPLPRMRRRWRALRRPRIALHAVAAKAPDYGRGQGRRAAVEGACEPREGHARRCARKPKPR